MSSTFSSRKLVEKTVGGKQISIETGFLAKQASGAVVVRIGDTMTLVAVVAGPGREGLDFFPLTVDYREKTYAAGKFPGGFIKREGRPTTKEILTSRLIDRPIRPLFPESYRDEVQIQAGPISADRQNDPDVLSMIGASAALMLARVPFYGPVGRDPAGTSRRPARRVSDGGRARGQRSGPDRLEHREGDRDDRGFWRRAARARDGRRDHGSASVESGADRASERADRGGRPAATRAARRHRSMPCGRRSTIATAAPCGRRSRS